MIPARNEATGLVHVLRALPPVDEVIVVDGGSADHTVAAARAARPGTRVVRQTRSGRGNALACGFAASSGDVVVTLHADGGTDPGEIPRLVDAVRAGADIAHASRFRPGGDDLTGGRPERAGAAVVSRAVNTALGLRCTDPLWGYNAYRRGALPALDLPGPEVPGRMRGRRAWGDGPEIDPLIIVRAALAGLRVVEVAGVGYPRIQHGGRRDVARRVLLALRTLLTELLLRRRSRGGAGTAPRGRRSAAVRPSPGRETPARTSSPASAAPSSAAGNRTAPVWTAGYRSAGRSTDQDAAAAGRHSEAVPVPLQRRRPLPSGLPGPRTRPPGPVPERTGDRGIPPEWPPIPSGPPAATPAGRDTDAGAPGRRRGHPGPRPSWATREPGAHRTVDITEYDTGVHHLPSDGSRRSGLYDTGVHRVGMYESGVHRTDVYGTGAHHVPDEDGPLYRHSAPRDVGGGRRRLDARDRHADGRPDLTVIPGDGGPAGGPDDRPHEPWRRDGRDPGRGPRAAWPADGGAGHRDHSPRGGRTDGPPGGDSADRDRDRRGSRPGHLRAVPGERSPR